MDNETMYFEISLPLFPIIFDSDPFEEKPMFPNQTEKQTSTILHRHPILYAIAFYALFLIIIGTIGNVLTIVVLLRANLRKHTTMRYLIAVAVADLCSLYSWNLNLFYKHLINNYQNDLEDGSIFSCRMISFIAFVSLQLSSWYLTLVSLDRCLNLHFLFWNRRFGGPNNAVLIILSVTILIVILNSHLLFLNGYRKANCVPFEKRTCIICYSNEKDAYYIFPKWEKFHLIIYNLVPFTIMLICSCFIIRRSIPSRQSTLHRHRSTRKCRQRKQRQITYLLLSVTFLFIILTLPVMIYNVFLRNSFIDRKPLKYILQGVLLCMQFTSHAINFFIYCHTASNIRHEVRALMPNVLMNLVLIRNPTH